MNKHRFPRILPAISRLGIKATESIESTEDYENPTHNYASKDSDTRVSETVPGTVPSSSFITSKVFIDEDEETQIKLILKWILQDTILDKNEKIRNITSYLEKMKYTLTDI